MFDMWKRLLASVSVCLALTLGFSVTARATDALSFAPVQTEREVRFINLDLGLKDELSKLEGKLGRAPAVEYAVIDLDADGEPELVIRIHQDGSCESDKCTTIVFSNAHDQWTRVLETDAPEVTVAKRMTKGYRDLLVGSQPWAWTGNRYMASR